MASIEANAPATQAPPAGSQAPGAQAAETGLPGAAGADAAVLTLMRMHRALERTDAGLTPQQYRILKLAGAGGERSARLAERLAVAKPTLTATADALVALGYAEREAEAGDRRVVRLRLTPAGRAAVERADAAYTGWLTSLLDDTGDPAAILRAFGELDAAMDERRRARKAVTAAPAHGAGNGS